MCTAGEREIEKLSEMFGPLSFESVNDESPTYNSETKCPLCEDSFNLSISLSIFLVHLFEVHNLVIEEVQYIENLPEYISYWRERFRKTSIESIVPSVTLDSTDNTYFLLSSLLEEDKKLRHKIKLNNAVKVQEFERTNAGYRRGCIFCRLAFEGSRSGFLQHLSLQHNLQLGNPQNLVFIDELIEKIDFKLRELHCIFCDKVFPQRNVLKEHMRKKLHKRINPSNREYDKFYIINYLEADKSWKAIQKEKDKYAVPVGSSANSDEEYSDWNEKDLHIICLFCSHKETNINALCSHMEADHNFDFSDLTKSFNFYEKIKLVNYIRKQVHNLRCIFCNKDEKTIQELQRHLVQQSHYTIPERNVFTQPEYYFPTYENDAFLYYIDDLDD